MNHPVLFCNVAADIVFAIYCRVALIILLLVIAYVVLAFVCKGPLLPSCIKWEISVQQHRLFYSLSSYIGFSYVFACLILCARKICVLAFSICRANQNFFRFNVLLIPWVEQVIFIENLIYWVKTLASTLIEDFGFLLWLCFTPKGTKTGNQKLEMLT